eukprot:1591851-Rhodomonas_salina.1
MAPGSGREYWTAQRQPDSDSDALAGSGWQVLLLVLLVLLLEYDSEVTVRNQWRIPTELACGLSGGG